jgi:hypothetical protein
LVFCLALALLPVSGAQPGATLAPITLYTQFHQQPPPALLESLQTEVQSIMAPMGLNFQWLSLSTSDGKKVAVELAVINFKGRCDVAGLVAHDSNPGALGWTHMSDGAILPFADVDCSAVRSFLQKELLFIRPQDREQVLGRALGRVLAHELYHIFANSTGPALRRFPVSIPGIHGADQQQSTRRSVQRAGSLKHRGSGTGPPVGNASHIMVEMNDHSLAVSAL